MTVAIDRLGLVVNPTAGGGGGQPLRVARAAVERLAPELVLTGPRGLGADALGTWPGRWESIPLPNIDGRAASIALATALCDAGVDAIVAVGGDGTLADVAGALLGCPLPPPIIGIGAGSINAGRLMTCTADEVDCLDPTRLRPERVDALIATVAGTWLGIACHDVAFGVTVVGTLDGRLRDLDAVALLEGRRVPRRPASIARPGALASVRHANGSAAAIARGEQVGAVVVGFARREFIANAISGGACLTALAGLPAACIVTDRPLVQVELRADELLGAQPISSRYASLASGSVVRVEGLAEGTVVALDGTPHRVQRPSDAADVSVRLSAVPVLRREDVA
ncbi:MAG: NAD(+)/NADH kinase [Chloroflexi bacterium]|nr:NAD(+)/NADH kinase [Chloroflexota bacterium]